MKTTWVRQGTVLAVLLLILNLPLVSALEISNVRAEEITSGSAVVRWDTDEPANSFVDYGTSAESFSRRGDSSAVRSHELRVDGLMQDTAYLFQVESNGVRENNGGGFYPFRTLPPDIIAPELRVELPEFVAGNRIEIAAHTESLAAVSLSVNGALERQITADRDGLATFANVVLRDNQMNTIRVQATDTAGNTATFDGAIFADALGPILDVANISSPVDQRRIGVNGTVSEESTVDIFINNRSVKTFEGVSAFSQEVNLEEGQNILQVKAVDRAGWEARKEVVVVADTQKPQIDFELLGGTEYYENRAETEIVGETKPGARLFLFIFREGLSRQEADFTRAVASVDADASGKFTFGNVSFPPPVFSTLKKLAPRQLPPGMEDVLISPLNQLSQEQRKSYVVYVVVEDALGRVNFKQQKVNINSCFSGSAFEINPIVDFQAPFRLDPSLMESGRESIQAVFNLTYRGPAVGFTDPKTGQAQEAFRITSPPKVQRACTQNTAETKDYELGCKLLPANPLNVIPNQDRSAIYVTATLNRASDFLKDTESPWDEFQRHQLKLPLKISFTYTERQVQGQDATAGWSSPKTEQFCYDLTYFVDVPIDSADMVPNFLIEDVVPALNDTVAVIDTIQPYLHYVMVGAGVGCVGSWFTRMATRFYRIFMSTFEIWTTKGSEVKCPPIEEQMSKYHLQSTIDAWTDLQTKKHPNIGEEPHKIPVELKPLESVCPQTAKAWELEATVDQFFRATCDRFFCREVPAGWTAQAEKQDVDKVVQAQKQCTATSNGVYLEEIENCKELATKNPDLKKALEPIEKEGNVCYRDAEGLVYYVDNSLQKNNLLDRNIWKLTYITRIGQAGKRPPTELLAYRPPGAQSFMVAPDLSCQKMCQQAGYKTVTDGYYVDENGVSSTNKRKVGATDVPPACYRTFPRPGDVVGLVTTGSLPDFAEGSTTGFTDGSNKAVKLTTAQFPAGYTNDCFVDNKGEKYQCICDTTKPDKELNIKSRIAVKEVNVGGQTLAEDWDYREATVYDESFGVGGTYYPIWRYYSGRDFTGAFGLDLGFDNSPSREFKPNSDPTKTINQKTSPTVNPHTDTLATFQSMCLPGINARLELVKSILIGVQNCLIEAKTTGLHDAGMCKTIFTQYVCGLIYKGISMFTNQCSPISINDIGIGLGDNAVAAALDSGFKAIPQAMSSSISDLKSTYANANVQQYFASGVQGFAESMCLAAFGYDFPMGMDFILDSAYSFPMKTAVIFPIASRELSTFNPVKGTATFRYNLGGSILPGCNIRGYRTYLKCIGPEDLNKPNVECSDEGCDCLQASNFETPFVGERTHVIQEGTSFTGVQRHKAFDLPIPSPQEVSKNFRYDHVVVELTLDQGEKPETCFDEGYQTPNGGQFYFPITPIKVPFGASCYVDGSSGRFICPQIGDFFGGGQTYFEHPFLRCYDDDTEEFVKCSTQNLFLLTNTQGNPDDIVIKPYINVGGEGACLWIKDAQGLISRPPVAIPSGINGPFSPTINLGSVQPQMIAGAGTSSIVRAAGGDLQCGGQNGQLTFKGYPTSDQARQHTSLSFGFSKDAAGMFTFTVPGGVQISADSAGYTIDATSRDLAFGGAGSGSKALTREQINSVWFSIEGFVFSNVLGGADVEVGGKDFCNYGINPGSASSALGVGSITLNMELRQLPPSGQCEKSNTLLPKGAFGLPTHTERITVQREASQVTEAAGMHRDFLNKKWNEVIEAAKGVVNRNEATFVDAKALYYYAAALVMSTGGSTSTNNADKDRVRSILDIFFTRGYGADVTVTNDQEYKKICKYMEQIDASYNPVPPAASASPPASPPAVPPLPARKCP